MNYKNEFLNTFFTHIIQLCFDKAKEYVEKERDSYRSSQMGSWGMLLMHLPPIVVAERSYADLGFIHTKNKGFLRKENSLKSMYESLKFDFKKVEEITRGSSSVDVIIAEISNQLCYYITARIQLIDFYEKIYNMSINSKIIRDQELILSMKQIIDSNLILCSHLALSSIKSAVILECEILLQLIKSYADIKNWKFLPSLMSLYGAQAKILGWEKTLHNKETWKLGFGSTFLKANQQSALYQWLLKLRGAILAKFSLYFHTTLSQQTNSSEMRSIMSKQAVDYYHKLQNFQRKHDITAITFIFDLRGIQDCGPSYQHPKRENNKKENFIMIMSIPQIFSQKYIIHFDNIITIIKEHYTDLVVMDKILFNRDESDMWIYAMCNIDPRVTFVVVYEKCSKQKDKDTHITMFISDLCFQMRCNKVFESLKLVK